MVMVDVGLELAKGEDAPDHAFLTVKACFACLFSACAPNPTLHSPATSFLPDPAPIAYPSQCLLAKMLCKQVPTQRYQPQSGPITKSVLNNTKCTDSNLLSVHFVLFNTDFVIGPLWGWYLCVGTCLHNIFASKHWDGYAMGAGSGRKLVAGE